MIHLYHNPRCKKSKAGLDYLRQHGIEPEIRLYLQDPLSPDEIKKLIRKLGMKPQDLVRTQEEFFRRELKGKTVSDEEWIGVFASNPKLIRRPVVESEREAVIGDPAENIQLLL